MLFDFILRTIETKKYLCNRFRPLDVYPTFQSILISIDTNRGMHNFFHIPK